jgi:AAA family ATP:ADP antiporter
MAAGCFLSFAALLLAGASRHAAAPAPDSARFLAVLISAASFILASAFWACLAPGAAGRRASDIRSIAAAGSAGALAGPALALLLVPRGPVALALVAAMLLGTAALLLPAPDPARAPAPSPARPDPAALATIAAFIVLTAAGGTFLYVRQLAIVADAFATPAQRASFFARAELVAAALLILCALRRDARSGTAAVPATIAAGLVLLAAWPGPAAAFLTVVARRLAEQCAARPARELAYDALGDTPRLRRLRLPVDALSGRAGDAASALLCSLGGLAFLLGGLAAALALGLVSSRLVRLPGKERSK